MNAEAAEPAEEFLYRFCLCVRRDLCVHLRAAGVSVVSRFLPSRM